MEIDRAVYIFTVLLLLPIFALASEPFYCSSTGFTNCLHISKEECIRASEKARQICSNKYDLDSKSFEEAKPLMKEFGNCATKEFMLLASLSEKDLQECEAHLTKATNLKIEKAKKRQEEYDKRFFEEDDHIHRYSR